MDLGKLSLEDALATVRGQAWPADDWSLIESLARGTRERQAEIDALITSAAEHWTLERMATVDRNILRMAVYEIETGATPVGVVINEAVELAKRYSTEESGRFVNGLLGKLVRAGLPGSVHQAVDV